MSKGIYKKLTFEDRFDRKYRCNSYRFVHKMKRENRRKMRRILKGVNNMNDMEILDRLLDEDTEILECAWDDDMEWFDVEDIFSEFDTMNYEEMLKIVLTEENCFLYCKHSECNSYGCDCDFVDECGRPYKHPHFELDIDKFNREFQL